MSERPATTSTSRPSRASIAFVMVLALFAAAPTVGDVGSCNAAVEALDAKAFFTRRLAAECARCDDCGLNTRACIRACDARTEVPTSFPAGCHPVVHDGEVCLHAIDALSCGAASDLVSDAPIVPTECDFCPAPATAPFATASAGGR